MTTGVLSRGLDWQAILRGVWFGLVALGAVGMALATDWSHEWAGVDFARYLSGDYADGYLYSPAFAALVASDVIARRMTRRLAGP